MKWYVAEDAGTKLQYARYGVADAEGTEGKSNETVRIAKK